jgi:hypothetical protein
LAGGIDPVLSPFSSGSQLPAVCEKDAELLVASLSDGPSPGSVSDGRDGGKPFPTGNSSTGNGPLPVVSLRSLPEEDADPFCWQIFDEFTGDARANC